MPTVVITGAAGDLGRATSDRFLAAGWTVVGADLRDDVLPGVHGERLDVTDRDAVFALAGRVASTFGLDAWVNNAGIVAAARLQEADVQTFDRLVQVNLNGTWHGLAAAFGIMTAGSAPTGGAIVNVGSLAAKSGAPGMHPGYGASKAAVHNLTRTYAQAGARHGVRVNAVAPSVLAGSMTQRFPPAMVQRLAQAHPTGRLGTVEEVASAVFYLCQPDAAYINGVVLGIDGGAGL